MLSSTLNKSLTNITQISSRIIMAELDTRPKCAMISAYAPHAGRVANDTGQENEKNNSTNSWSKL